MKWTTCIKTISAKLTSSNCQVNRRRSPANKLSEICSARHSIHRLPRNLHSSVFTQTKSNYPRPSYTTKKRGRQFYVHDLDLWPLNLQNVTGQMGRRETFWSLVELNRTILWSGRTVLYRRTHVWRAAKQYSSAGSDRGPVKISSTFMHCHKNEIAYVIFTWIWRIYLATVFEMNRLESPIVHH